jgi:hypothetical protein
MMRPIRMAGSGRTLSKLLAIPLLVAAWPAAWIGANDLLGPVSFSSQLLGALFAAGCVCIVLGIGEIVCLGFPPTTEAERKPGRFAFYATAAGALVALSIAVSALGYRVEWVILFGIIAVINAIMAVVVVQRENLAVVSGVLKSLLLAGGTLIAVTSFTYQNIYIPGNTEVGIEYQIAVGKPLHTSRYIYLIPVHLTFEDKSSVSATALTSLVTITGISYTGHGQKRLPLSIAQEHVNDEGREVAPSHSRESALQDIFSGQQHRSELAVTKLIRDGSQILPGARYSRNMLVAIPRVSFHAVTIKELLFYASTTRLTLVSNKPSYGTVVTEEPGCTHTVRREWQLRESEFRTFSRGHQVLVTNWCADLQRQRASAFVRNEANSSPGTRTRNDRLYGVHRSERIEELALP